MPDKKLATLTDAEDARWIDVFADAVNSGKSDNDADAEAWETLQAEFPRLNAFDGCKP